MRRDILVLGTLLAVACQKPATKPAGDTYKPRTEMETVKPEEKPDIPPITVINNTPKELPRPSEQEQPPAPPTTPPTDPAGEETGSGSSGDMTRPYGGGIGASCSKSAKCGGDATVCLASGFDDGLCSKPCSRFCPDYAGKPNSTLCVADQSASGGICVPRCESDSDCRTGYKCQTDSRFKEPAVTAKVCMPAKKTERSCEATLKDIVPYSADALAPEESWTDCNATAHACAVRDAVQVPFILNGTSFLQSSGASDYLTMSCRMAHTLFRLGYVAKRMKVGVVSYARLYACEGAEDMSATSEHGLGEALDITSITISGKSYGPDSQQMRDFLEQAQYYHIFNNIYTKACNEALFSDHVHADLGLGQNPVRDLVAGHWDIDDETSSTCQLSESTCGP